MMWTANCLLVTLAIHIPLTAASSSTQTDYLSPRATQAINGIQTWINNNQTVLSHPYDPVRFPSGMVSLTHNQFTIDPLYHLTYGQGPAASPPLRRALADFFNRRFNAQPQVSPYEIVVGSGVTSLIDSVIWSTCSANESFILPRPLFNSFPHDMGLRSSGLVMPASFMWNNQTSSLDDVFNATAIRHSLTQAWSKEALLEIARFCGERHLHFISDEIYANSVFTPPHGSKAPPFTSVLSLDLAGVIDPNLVHVLYGMSKDFGASGLRLGALHSRNENLIQAATGVNLFAWPSDLVQDMWARLLQNQTATDHLLDLNSERLGVSYGVVTSWLVKQNIEYFQDG
ncbi:PLP-dependent transferase [Aspergillus saccharolyticus JOP 1030-1]|uniref:PLP-dependent transferase n=1 Tax=Aspergillus saccharolyticus JOP 1030-1 TaxID=1450539 RepID=A0A318ZP97_9EURO|nr:PLP-dependent transferase [Aspergillus saccharolyticus JOP 1030-1]PYH49366.1 PLP-dependent transferase [Aspergillus saccharolyticus JOP 1030-1]